MVRNEPSTYTVPGFSPTPRSGPRARFDNVEIARASEAAADLNQLAAATGYSLEDGGAFRRRLASMVASGQIDPKFKPSPSREPQPKQLRAARNRQRVGASRSRAERPLAWGQWIRDAVADAIGGDWAEDIEVPSSGHVRVARQSVTFDRGDLAAMPATTPQNYRKKGLVTVAGSDFFAELAVTRLFSLAGWTAYWRDGFRHGWVADGDMECTRVRELPPSLGRTVVGAVQNARGSLSGCWDVVAWKGDHVAFAECKRHLHDRLQPTQGYWLRAALDVGVPLASFVVVEWTS